MLRWVLRRVFLQRFTYQMGDTMTDQKQAPERIDARIPDDAVFQVKEGYEVGAAKVDADGNLQRIAEFSEALEIRSADDVLEAAEKRIETLRKGLVRFQQETEEADKTSDEHLNARYLAERRAEKSEAERDQALASVGAVIEKAARIGGQKFCDSENTRRQILKINPDATAVLNEMLRDAWVEGMWVGLGEDSPPINDNPYRTPPSRSSDAGKSEDRG